MNKYKLLRLFLSLKKSTEKGLSLIELIVALVMSGIVLTMAASGFVNVLRANQDVESKSVRNTGLQKALAFLQEDLKQATAAEQVTTSQDANCNSVDSKECLRLDMPDARIIYYGYKDISSLDSVFLKPGILKRQVYLGTTTTPLDDSNLNNLKIITTAEAWDEKSTTVADGLINTSLPTTNCTSNGVSWNTTNVYGRDASNPPKGGFRFCLNPPSNHPTSPNRLVRIFLYGRTINNNSTGELEVNTLGFARAQSRLMVNALPNNSSNSATVRAYWRPVTGITFSDPKFCTTTSDEKCTPSSSYTSGTAISNFDLSTINITTGKPNSNVCFSLSITDASETKTEIKCVR